FSVWRSHPSFAKEGNTAALNNVLSNNPNLHSTVPSPRVANTDVTPYVYRSATPEFSSPVDRSVRLDDGIAHAKCGDLVARVASCRTGAEGTRAGYGRIGSCGAGHCILDDQRRGRRCLEPAPTDAHDTIRGRSRSGDAGNPHLSRSCAGLADLPACRVGR